MNCRTPYCRGGGLVARTAGLQSSVASGRTTVPKHRERAVSAVAQGLVPVPLSVDLIVSGAHKGLGYGLSRTPLPSDFGTVDSVLETFGHIRVRGQETHAQQAPAFGVWKLVSAFGPGAAGEKRQ